MERAGPELPSNKDRGDSFSSIPLKKKQQRSSIDPLQCRALLGV